MLEDRVCIFIDGGNFYHLALKKLGIHETDFDFEAFATFLASGRTIPDMGKRYYIGTVRERVGDPRTVEAMARQGRIFTQLRKGGWEVKTSKLRERTERLQIDARVQDAERLRKLGVNEVVYVRDREKGIDVKIVTDLFIGAYDDRYDTAIIVSSDTDLVPAIDSVRYRFKKKVEYVGFSMIYPRDPTVRATPVHAMLAHTDTQRALIDADLKQFVVPRLV